MHKIFTLSFDDGVTQDVRFTELLKQYGLTCTFNINSALLGTENRLVLEGGFPVSHNKNAADQVARIYRGFEVAAHTRTHPALTRLSCAEIVEEVVGDYLKLSELTGYAVRGMAYPGGPPNYDRLVVDTLKKYTSVRYARAYESTYSLSFPEDYLVWRPSVHILDPRVGEMIDRFAAEKSDCLLYIWGHTFEFDAPGGWERAERVLARLSALENAVCMTNMQVYEAFSK